MVATREYSARVCALDALLDPEKQIAWANEVWEHAWQKVEEEYEITDHVIGLVRLSLIPLLLTNMSYLRSRLVLVMRVPLSKMLFDL